MNTRSKWPLIGFRVGGTLPTMPLLSGAWAASGVLPGLPLHG